MTPPVPPLVKTPPPQLMQVFDLSQAAVKVLMFCPAMIVALAKDTGAAPAMRTDATRRLCANDFVMTFVAPFDVFQIMRKCVPRKLNCCLNDGSWIIQK
jgi:hypothetical protein